MIHLGSDQNADSQFEAHTLLTWYSIYFPVDNAASIHVLVSTVDQMTMCNVKMIPLCITPESAVTLSST